MEELSRASGLREWADIDSLDLAEFFMELEEEFGVKLPDPLCAEFNTIGDVMQHIENELAK